MILKELSAALKPHLLDVNGGFHPGPQDGLDAGVTTVVLIGPGEPGFWPHVTAQPEFGDGETDPLDRWSRRVLGSLARDLGAQALFPFGGPPWHPFVAWAQRSGRAWLSPVGLLVHDTAGLFVSYRGALAFGGRIDLPALPPRPCDTCTTQPCRGACPVAALTPDGYDVSACRAYLTTPAGADCMTKGCAVRRSCPVSRAYGRPDVQFAFHMKAFAK